MGNDQEFTKDIENTNKNQAEIPNTVVLDQPISDPATDAKIAFYKKPNFLRFSLYGIAAIAVVLMFLGIGSLIVHATMPPINENSEPTATALILPEGVTIPPFSSQNKSSGVSRAINLNVDFRPSLKNAQKLLSTQLKKVIPYLRSQINLDLNPKLCYGQIAISLATHQMGWSLASNFTFSQWMAYTIAGQRARA